MRAAYGYHLAPPLQSQAVFLPKCARTDCAEKSYNGCAGEYCSKSCRNKDQTVDVFSSWFPCAGARKEPFLDFSFVFGIADWIGSIFTCDLQPKNEPQPIDFRCSQGNITDGGIIAFYYPARCTPVDRMCQAEFLGNFYSRRLEMDGFAFRNAEAAFQSLKWWHRRQVFEQLSGEEAFQMSRRLRDPDMTYAGHGSNWKAMSQVLLCKFEDPYLREKLAATGDALLLEHNEVSGRDKNWSNNHDGSGKNWLGMQLMLVREGGRGPWTKWLQQHVNLSTGECLDAAWPWLVHRATMVTLRHLEDFAE